FLEPNACPSNRSNLTLSPNFELDPSLWCECRESNPDRRLRRPLHYPLCYTRIVSQGAGSNRAPSAASSRGEKPLQAPRHPFAAEHAKEPVEARPDRRAREREARRINVVARSRRMGGRERLHQRLQGLVAREIRRCERGEELAK